MARDLIQGGANQDGFSEEMIVELTSRIIGDTLSGHVKHKGDQES